jgi:2-keto-4-pentenoate hydratase/2-oxohepta-3-ene-1,7-dioic acid hydratase in catechol pathway
MAAPAEPVLFAKTSNTMVGPYDDVLIPRDSVKTDWEVELGIVIGKTARNLSGPEEAAACIAGYCVSHDVSERSYQLERGGQWIKGKSCDTFNPLGPWLVTPDEVGDVRALDLWLNVNGQRMQTGNTRNMIFDVYFIVQYISRFLTLEPGDVINTGTPPGVGLGRGVYLRSGDVVELGVQGLGAQRQTFH